MDIASRHCWRTRVELEVVRESLYTRGTPEIACQAELSGWVIEHEPLEALSELVDVLVGVADQVQCAASCLLDELDDLILRLVQVLSLVHEKNPDIAVSAPFCKCLLLNQLAVSLDQFEGL